jgi:hypothetical protein
MTAWLDRSGQRWKLRAGTASTWAGVALFVVWVVLKWHFALLGAIPLFTAGLVLPMLIRCRVCGLQLPTSHAALEQPAVDRETWLSRLEACPACEDDGLATSDQQLAWSSLGRARERPYWSWRRVLAAGLLAVIFVLGGIAIAELRIRSWVGARQSQGNDASER